MFDGLWKKRALEAEAALAAQTAAIDQAKEYLNGVQLLMAERATLVSITRDGQAIRFIFARNETLHHIDTYGTWDCDVEGWKKVLLAPLTDEADANS